MVDRYQSTASQIILDSALLEGHIMQVKNLKQLPREMLAPVAKAIARDIDAGQDKHDMLEALFVEIATRNGTL